MSGRLACKRTPVAVLIAVSLILVSFPGPLFAQGEDERPRFSFDGHFRLRGEADGRTAGSKPDYGVLSRVRLGVKADLLDWLDVYAQIQDARIWGTETNPLTDGSADNLDMHQIYADLGRGSAFKARFGRQIMALADERLIGAVEWVNTGLVFDGVRLMGEANGITWTAFAMNIFERDDVLSVGLNPQTNQGIYDDGWLIGGFATTEFGGTTTELTAAYDRDALTDHSYTLNLRAHGRSGDILYEGAGAYQFGPDRSAFFGSGRVGLAIGRGSIAAQLDYLSGNSETDTDKVKAFNTLYATNHKFYGYMDYFLFIPQQLDGAGLVDAMLRASYKTSASTTARVDLHRFATAHERTTLQTPDGAKGLGTELDLVGRWTVAAPATLDAGIGIFVPDDLATGLLPAFADGKKTTWWAFVQFFIKYP
jgi:hypothetical protein